MSKKQLSPIGAMVVAAIVFCLSAAATAADARTGSVIDLRFEQEMIDRDDYEAGLLGDNADPGPLCEIGLRNGRYTEPAAACRAAYGAALGSKAFDRALRYAAIGCMEHQDHSQCRRVGGLPLVMGNAGVPVPAAVADELKRIANFVCLWGSRFTSLGETDITGRECAYFARQFVLARDPEYAWALEPAAREYFEAIHEPARAVRLYQIACEHWGYASSCNSSVEVGQRINLRDHAEVTEILEREAGAALVDAAAIASGFAYDGALSEGKFEQALRYAVTGCEKHKDANQCRQVADLPVHVGNRGIPPAPLFAAEVKRMADFVCLSGNRVKNGGGDDITGRICDHFALQFVMAKDRDSSQALSPTARQYLNLIYQPTRAGKLYKAACERHAYSSSCRHARSVEQRDAQTEASARR